MLGNCFVALGELKPNKNLESINDSGDESDHSDLFIEAQRGMDDFFPCTHAEFYPCPDISLIEQAGSEAEWEANEEEPFNKERGFKREGRSEGTEDVRGEAMESKRNRHVLALADSSRNNEGAINSKCDLAILRTCRQVYAEASPLFYSRVEVVITPEEVVDLNVKEEFVERSAEMKQIRPDYMRHSKDTDYEKGIFDILGLASLLDFAAFARVERIRFDADYNFLLVDDSPSLYVDDDFYTSCNDEEELISFMKRTRTVENFVSLLATLPRLRQLELILVVEVKPEMDLDSEDELDEEDDEQDSKDFEKIDVANERATEIFIECGILDPLRKLSNVQHFDLEVQTQARKNDNDLDFMVLKPKHARIVQDLKKAIELNWIARSSIH